MKEQKYTIYRVVFTIVSVSIVSFIFRNSSMNAFDSTLQSTSVLDAILVFFENLGMNLLVTENFVRKCAHFVEFSLLSISLFLMYHSYFLKLKKTVISTLLTGLTVAGMDEIIQIFSDGRSAQFSDVLLDFSGVVTTALVISIVYLLYKNKRGREYKNE